MKTTSLYPIKFTPILKEKVWGGANLVGKLGKIIPDPDKGEDKLDASHIGESWEISSVEGDVSVAGNGFLKGNNLDDILETYMGNFEGDNVFDYYGMQFPLLIKYLDVHGRLSVQVHPDDKTALERSNSLGKTEFWYVMESSPEAEVYMGFKRKTSASEFYGKCKDGSVEELMNVFHPEKGECFFIKAGTVHAAKGDIVIAEIQETSDMTYRVYDWGREFNPATRREMHLEQAIDCINYEKYDEETLHVKASSLSRNLVKCKYFTINNVSLKYKYYRDSEDFNSCIIYMCTAGKAELDVGKGKRTFSLNCGETILVPKDFGVYAVAPKSEGTNILEIHVDPIETEKDEYIDETKAAHLDGEPQEPEDKDQAPQSGIDPDDWDLKELGDVSQDERIMNIHLGDE
ncbi:MAG: class I mannose-6-phosphate isomerase [Bacteroidales bacterium]|jgi:mannose-6-phosphate isomerase|nr:class I mannose-6-phosphate isomerase [Bacteroidales bacterium]MCI2121283.1 class I mannose-6-phosphate isomerase [Bacteroidales bacterium]MCI2145227.1 class I mannose-6-phosphate isomerase [Bacteroidales bacterium]